MRAMQLRRAVSGRAAVAPPRSVMNSRRLMCCPQSEDCTLCVWTRSLAARQTIRSSAQRPPSMQAIVLPAGRQRCARPVRQRYVRPWALTVFAGFGNIALNNFSNGTGNLILAAGPPIVVTEYGTGADQLTLASGAVTYHGGSGGAAVVSTSAANWNAADVIDGGSGAALDLNWNGVQNATYDLTGNALSNINGLCGQGSKLTVKINTGTASGIASFNGLGPNDQLLTSDVTLDLSHSLVNGFTVASTNASGTTFIVQDVNTAFEIAGGPGQDSIVASGFAFTAAQRNVIFATASVEKITDTSGSYAAAAVPATLVGVASVASFTEKGGPIAASPALSIATIDSNFGQCDGRDYWRPRTMGGASSGSRFCWRACKLLRRIAMPIFTLHCTAQRGCWRGRCVLTSSSDEHRGC
jgi:hypothetical protein